MKKFAFTLSGMLSCMLIVSYFFFTSCQFSTARIEKTEFVKIDSNRKQVNVDSTYSPYDGPFHLFVTIANAPEDTKVKASWYAINAGGDKNKLIDAAELTVGNLNELDFTLSLPRPWPLGSYRVDLTLNGKFDRSRAFNVK